MGIGAKALPGGEPGLGRGALLAAGVGGVPNSAALDIAGSPAGARGAGCGGVFATPGLSAVFRPASACSIGSRSGGGGAGPVAFQSDGRTEPLPLGPPISGTATASKPRGAGAWLRP